MLDDVGATEADVRGFKIELDVDDGISKYEIEFYLDGIEYEYEINAKSGNIISSDKEYDD